MHLSSRAATTRSAAAARLGDLREMALDAENAVPEGAPPPRRFCCWMNTVEREMFTRPFEGDEADESAKKYEHSSRASPASRPP